ncbi:hypothetical protein ACET3Z_008568 [Daucus carota]
MQPQQGAERGDFGKGRKKSGRGSPELASRSPTLAKNLKMDPAAYLPGPVNGTLLTLQDTHRSTFVWNSSTDIPDLRVRTNFARERLAMIRDVLGLTPEAADVRKNCLRVGDDYEGGPRGFTVRLEDDQDMSAEGQSQESYQFQDADAYRPDMSFLRDQYTTPPPQVPVPSFASQSYIFGAPAFPFAPPPERSTPTPIQMSTFASYTGQSSPWAPPSTAVAGHSEAEEQPEDEHRQQPPRAAKGKGRRCHTGSHIFGHKKK